MKKYIFTSYKIVANNEDEAWDELHNTLQDNSPEDIFIVSESDIDFETIKELNLLGLNKKELKNIKEENLDKYINKLEELCNLGEI